LENGWMDGWMDVWMDGWMDGWMDYLAVGAIFRSDNSIGM